MASRISVCMAVKNGESFIHEQLASILPQLAGEDELIISDDHSSDCTLKIIQGIGDPRIRLIQNEGHGLIANFENALGAAHGTYIFLADQDDVWMPDKVKITLHYLESYDLVVTDCMIVNECLELTQKSFYDQNHSRKGLFRNLFKNSYMGCCMAFHKKVLAKSLPFPDRIPMHDSWIGLIAEIHFQVIFVKQKLLVHRRHRHNASTTSRRSNFSLADKLSWRYWLLKNVISISYAA